MFCVQCHTPEWCGRNNKCWSQQCRGPITYSQEILEQRRQERIRDLKNELVRINRQLAELEGTK